MSVVHFNSAHNVGQGSSFSVGSGPNRILVLFGDTSSENEPGDVRWLTGAGAQFTQIYSQEGGPVSNDFFYQAYYLLETDIGTTAGGVFVNTSVLSNLALFCLEGVDQSIPLNADDLSIIESDSEPTSISFTAGQNTADDMFLYFLFESGGGTVTAPAGYTSPSGDTVNRKAGRKAGTGSSETITADMTANIFAGQTLGIGGVVVNADGGAAPAIVSTTRRTGRRVFNDEL